MSDKEPIIEMQSRVMRAEALCRCIAVASESSEDIDYYSALNGLADNLEKLATELGHDTFRAAVLKGLGS